MILIPAIDIKNKQSVRLTKGEMDHATVYADTPLAMAKKWELQGARRLHIVDLDGAIAGHPVHFDQIREIIQTVPVEVQVGGGIRTLEQIENYLMAGAAWVVLGTSILQNRPLVEKAIQQFPKKIIAGIDCKQGRVAIRGWVETTGENPVRLAMTMKEIGVTAIVLTDIEKDGMLAGPNEALFREMAGLNIPIIASGGITTLDDIKRLNEIPGIEGAIIGKALYSGKISYPEANALVQKSANKGPAQ